ncbi:anthranilate synthase component I [Bacillaceae bacterium Marseille-Q3522]|nr:anthranilate synthase component I [Bacillaceae bacterium Marseille-Q3522]
MGEKNMFMMKELEGDLLTPVLIYEKLPGKKKFILESSLKHETSGRFSFIGSNPAFELKGFGDKSYIVHDNKEEFIAEPPLDVLKTCLPVVEIDEDLPFPFQGGAIGYAGYETIRQYENIGDELPDELHIPDVHFLFFENFIVFDHLQQKIYAVVHSFTKETTEEELKKRLHSLAADITGDAAVKAREKTQLSAFKDEETAEDYCRKVEICKRHIEAGDIFQVVPSRRLKASFSGEGFSYYRHLRTANPSPYMYFLDFADYAIAGTSPESLIKTSGRMVTGNPIAGTRPRGKTTEHDKELEKDLLADEKELAEHRMLVDLCRNDIGRVSEFGSVRVKRYLQVERYTHVMHLVSEVEGKLKDGITAADALIVSLPAGTVTGAPKIRAMEIINELEKTKRGVYSGAIGYISTNGNSDFALAIRTMILKDNTAYIQAGAGVVYDSVPQKEYEETNQKLKFFLEDSYDLTH